MPFTVTALAEAAPDAIEALLDAAFGADRRGRTAYRLREGAACLPELSFAAWEERELIGTLQSWPVALRTGAGAEPLVMVGPVAVLPDNQGQGVGTVLMDALIAAAEAQGARALMMIGDPEYYSRWSFTAERTGGWWIDGRYEQHRLLARLRREASADGQLIPIGHMSEGRDPSIFSNAA